MELSRNHVFRSFSTRFIFLDKERIENLKKFHVYTNVTVLFFLTLFLFRQVAMLFDKLRVRSFSILIQGESTEIFHPIFL